MSRWHRENPEYYEQYGEPDWFRAHDAADHVPCRVCGEAITKGGRPCQRCKDGMEHDRLERESNR